ncbi:hypothetical protein [Prosthecobacter sp.]|uniref:hypothetical protein n=1 Tax=Prosthecobacter sp. TaxID=1965333 RepID=UPI00248A7360|nr:hypothetical protein [Prosthecobacter sp.]MDI1312291.1 hypothetical protein [Prosthecobacter sp.]
MAVSAFVGFTHNSEASGGVVASFDLLCLSGMIVSVLADDSFSTSTGMGLLSIHLYIDDTMDLTVPVNLSVRSTDSSALRYGMLNGGLRPF